MVEAQIPVPIPIPGVKLGLANIVTVYVMFVLGPGDALLVLSARVFLGAVFSGQMSTLLYSAGGGLLCWLAQVVKYGSHRTAQPDLVSGEDPSQQA